MTSGGEKQREGNNGELAGLETWTKAMGLFALVAYILGVVAVAAYTESLDVPSPNLDLFKARYIFTGGLVLVTFLIPGACTYAMSHLVWETYVASETNTGRQPRDIFSAFRRTFASGGASGAMIVLLLGLAAFVALQILLVGLSDRIPDDSPRYWLHLLVLTSISCASGVFGFLWWRYSGHLGDTGNPPDDETKRRVPVHAKRAASGLAVVLCAVSSAILFAHWVYAFIPEQFGGGKARHVVLSFNQDGLRIASDLGIQLQRKTNASVPMEMLHQDDAQYTVRFFPTGRSREDRRTAQIEKSVVLGYSADSRRPQATDLLVTSSRNFPVPTSKEDKVEFVFSEEIKKQSVLPKWDDGAKRWVRVILRTPNGGGESFLRLRRNGQYLRIGNLRVLGFGLPAKNDALAALRKDGKKFILTLKDDLLAFKPKAQQRVDGFTWTPSAKAQDDHDLPVDDRATLKARLVQPPG